MIAAINPSIILQVNFIEFLLKIMVQNYTFFPYEKNLSAIFARE